MRGSKTSLHIALWGGAGGFWMAWLLHAGWLRGAMLTDCVGLWSANYLPRFRGVAPIGDLLLFNAWMMATTAGEWIILCRLVEYIGKRLSK